MIDQLETRYISEFQAETNRQKWENMAKQLKNKGVDISIHNLDPRYVYANLRLTLNACGIKSKKEWQGKKVLIIGVGSGLEVRIARDLGIDAVGVDYDKRIVDLSHKLGITTPQELMCQTANQFLKETPDDSLDIIMGLNQEVSPNYPLQSLYEFSYNPLKRSGIFIVSGDINQTVVKRMPNFPITEISAMPFKDTVMARKV